MKRSKNTKPKPLKGKKLTTALDNIIRQIFKAKYGENPTCFVCGHKDAWWNSKTAPRGIQVGHYISRGRTALRWNLDNLRTNCSACNIRHNQNPAPFTLVLIEEMGLNHIKKLETISREAVGNKVTDREKRRILEELEAMLHT